MKSITGDGEVDFKKWQDSSWWKVFFFFTVVGMMVRSSVESIVARLQGWEYFN